MISKMDWEGWIFLIGPVINSGCTGEKTKMWLGGVHQGTLGGMEAVWERGNGNSLVISPGCGEDVWIGWPEPAVCMCVIHPPV